MLQKKSVRDVEVTGKRVFVRVDFNVPIKDGSITDETRILGALPTINYLIEQGAKVILASHLGKPAGNYDKVFSLEAVAKRLEEHLGKKVFFKSTQEVVDDEIIEYTKTMKNGDVVLLENTRFQAGEKKNDPELSKKFAALCDVFVDDAFGSAHRAHASNVGITEFVDNALMGFLMEKELEYLDAKLSKPERPYVAILGGAKVSDKIKVIENFLDKVDRIIIGGAMAYTFLASQGIEIGKSLVEEDQLDYAKNMIEKAKQKNVELLLPVDHLVSEAFENTKPVVTEAEAIPSNMMALDIGPKTIENYKKALKDAKTVVWNGPMGAFEMSNYATGTKEIAKALAESGALSVIGGGDSAAAVTQFGFADQMSHISTGGGASLTLLEGTKLPGVEALTDRS